MAQVSIKMLEKYSELIEQAKSRVLAVAEESWKEHGNCIMGLSGGKTPVGLYKKLNQDFPKLGIDFFIVDERNVPADDEKSNYFLIKNSLFKGKPEALKKLHDFETNLPKEKCLSTYENLIQRFAPNGLDLAILGVGKDGHFASIFPGFQNWDTKAVTCATETEVNEVKERYSLSPNYLFRSRHLLVLLAGQDKMESVNNLMKENLGKEKFPAKFLLQHPRLEFIYCHEAAS
jgi:6-phosphogluconolactonase